MFAEVEQIRTETLQFEEAAARASELNEELSRKLTLKRSYPAEVLERLDALVPSEVNEVKILHDLDEIARSHNMLFGNVTVANNDGAEGDAAFPATVTRTATYDDLEVSDINFSLIGTYEQFKAFLNDLEQSLVLIEVTTIDFRAGEGMLQQYNMSARVFALPPIE